MNETAGDGTLEDDGEKSGDPAVRGGDAPGIGNSM